MEKVDWAKRNPKERKQTGTNFIYFEFFILATLMFCNELKVVWKELTKSGCCVKKKIINF